MLTDSLCSVIAMSGRLIIVWEESNAIFLFITLQLQSQTNAEGSAILVLDNTAGELHNKVHFIEISAYFKTSINSTINKID